VDTIEALKTRRSIRRYLNRPVEKEKIETIIDCAHLAPTAINIQPWEFIVLTDPKIKKAVADETDYGKFIKDAPVAIIVLCKNVKYYLEDGCAATTNIVNAAHALGLGTCWIAGDKKPYAEKILEIIRAPKDCRLVSLISMGYPMETSPSNQTKRPLNEVIHWESF
jgi:nitroreductase